MVTVAVQRARVRADIVRLAHRGLRLPEFARAVGDALCTAVPAEGTCLMTTDPATLLPTAEYVEHGLPAPELLRLVEMELREPDFNKWTHLARASRPAASLSWATSGELDRSLRQREIRRPGGFGDELRVVLSGDAVSWGQLTVFREAKRRNFSAAEVHFVSSLAGVLADGVRRGLLLDGWRAGADEFGLVLLNADDCVLQVNQTAERWLSALGTGERMGSVLPVVVPAVARQARALADPAGLDLRPARARAYTSSGQWLTVRGSTLGRGPYAPVAVMLEPARRAELAPLIAGAYCFTDSERRVTELVAQGLSTKQIAARLRVSHYTVQDHLKSIFTKSGTGSRGDLVARLFLDHYATRLTSTDASEAHFAHPAQLP